jgi:hypothetical protein
VNTNDSPKKPPKRSGPKPKELTPAFVFACGKMFCTQEEIGDLCGLDQSTISARLNGDPELKQAFISGRAQGKMSLRRAQFKKAVTDENLVAQIWLGKQELGQSDKQESHETHDVNVNVQYVAAWGKTPNELPPPPENQDLPAPDDPDVIDSTATEDPPLPDSPTTNTKS